MALTQLVDEILVDHATCKGREVSIRLGRDDQFDDNLTIRLKAINLAAASYKRTVATLREEHVYPLLRILPNPTFYLLPQGHQENLMFDTRALFQASRELLDFYLGCLWRATAGSATRTPVKFGSFLPQLASGVYDCRPEPIFAWLKQGISWLYTIRAIRNELKVNPASAQFHIETNNFMMKIALPFPQEHEIMLPFLNLRNLDAAQANRRFFLTLSLDEQFGTTPRLWNECENMFNLSFPRDESAR